MKSEIVKKWWFWTLIFIWIVKLSSASVEGEDALVSTVINLIILTALIVGIGWLVKKVKRK